MMNKSTAVRVAAMVKRAVQHGVRVFTEAKMRRIQHELEFHRSLLDYHRNHNLPLLGQEDRLSRF